MKGMAAAAGEGEKTDDVEEESIAASMKRICYSEGIVVKGKYLIVEKMKEAFRSNLLEMSTFEQYFR